MLSPMHFFKLFLPLPIFLPLTGIFGIHYLQQQAYFRANTPIMTQTTDINI